MPGVPVCVNEDSEFHYKFSFAAEIVTAPLYKEIHAD
jgi:hypothetical protein